MPPLVIRSTRVVLANGVTPGAVHVADSGRIDRIADYDAPLPGAATLHDGGALVIMPGVVDTHVHVNEPGRTDWEGFDTATAAAAAGGVTTIVDMPLNSIPATTTTAALAAKRAAARGTARVDVACWGGVVPGNTRELAGMCAAGVCGFKCFLVPSGVDEFPAVSAVDLRAALPILADHGAPLLVHAESPGALAGVADGAPRDRYATWLTSRPDRAEVEAIELMIALCRESGTRVHIVHLSSAQALPPLRAARARGLPITVETCPHYLTFAAEDIGDGDTRFKCAPPIRSRGNREALWAALQGADIDLVASDHSPCPPLMKTRGDFIGAWGGIGSLELSLAAVWTGASRRGSSIADVVRWQCARPAALAGLSHRKGALAEGLDADVVVFDPDATRTIDARTLHQRHTITPYDGLTLRGIVRETYVRGRLVYRDGGAVAAAGGGELLARPS